MKTVDDTNATYTILIFPLGKSWGAVLSELIDDIVSLTAFGDAEALMAGRQNSFFYENRTLFITPLWQALHDERPPHIKRPKVIIPKLYPEGSSYAPRRGYIVEDPEVITDVSLTQIHPLPELMQTALRVPWLWGVVTLENQLILLMDLPPQEV
ncbi:MAG: hypothetical protein D6675_02680 [Gemmatimonadetes bacterium]|nr:MAG: hypothetical protein D6675_02680 [Gemmatimonadota bacterium]